MVSPEFSSLCERYKWGSCKGGIQFQARLAPGELWLPSLSLGCSSVSYSQSIALEWIRVWCTQCSTRSQLWLVPGGKGGESDVKAALDSPEAARQGRANSLIPCQEIWAGQGKEILLKGFPWQHSAWCEVQHHWDMAGSKKHAPASGSHDKEATQAGLHFISMHVGARTVFTQGHSRKD